MKKIIIAIDGPAGSGKTTTAREVARRLGYLYIDTGAMYRAVTLAWLKENLPMEESAICGLMEKISIELTTSPSGQLTFLNGEDVSGEIRSPEVSRYVSPVSAIKCVRTKLVNQQRLLGMKKCAVLDGRDIGTVVFPDAELKIYLVASIESRAKRRMLEMQQKGLDLQLDVVKQQISDRDLYDSSRELDPLRKADDAIEVDTSALTIEQQTDFVEKLALKLINDVE